MSLLSVRLTASRQFSEWLPAIAVVEAHDIVEFGSARFEHHSVHDRGHPMSCARWEVNRLTGEQLEGLEFTVEASDLEEEVSRLDGDGLLLPLVVLEREGVALKDVQSLSAVLAIDNGEVNLVAPRLLDPFDVLDPISLRHDEEARRRNETSSVARQSTRLSSAEFVAAPDWVVRTDIVASRREESRMKLIIRLIVLALAGFGAWKLWEQYGSRVPAVRGSIDEFSTRTTSAANDAAERVGSAAEDATAAIKDSVADIESAAKDAQVNVARNLR